MLLSPITILNQGLSTEPEKITQDNSINIIKGKVLFYDVSVPLYQLLTFILFVLRITICSNIFTVLHFDLTDIHHQLYLLGELFKY